MRPLPSLDPELGDRFADDLISDVIVPRMRDLGGFSVRRALPSVERQMVGPFILFDHAGPGEMLVSEEFDVRPHPHIGLATVTYLYDGAIIHRDSIGSEQAINPGDINWMTAGRGIAHSERARPEDRNQRREFAGLQTWVALPRQHEEAAPTFTHHPRTTLPIISGDGAEVRLAVGSLYGERAPAGTFSDMFYADATLDVGASLPIDPEHEERAAYLLDGCVEVAGDKFDAGRLLVFRPGDALAIKAITPARVMLLGGETMDGPRHIWWNFVSSSKERIEEAKNDWKQGRFDKVFGDEKDFIPMPE
jgi:redox-sensitive bicupin YhaK (pirin superfamily)